MAEEPALSEGPRPSDRALLVRRVIATLAGGVFLYAGLNKVADPMRFANDIGNYQLLPWTLGVRLAFYLPWLEIVCGLALIVHRLFRGALALAMAMTLVFTGATISARVRGIDVACGCFGTASSNLTLTWHLVLNGCIFLGLIGLWVTRRGTRKSALT